jgi:hypothetical protein
MDTAICRFSFVTSIKLMPFAAHSAEIQSLPHRQLRMFHESRSCFNGMADILLASPIIKKQYLYSDQTFTGNFQVLATKPRCSVTADEHELRGAR